MIKSSAAVLAFFIFCPSARAAPTDKDLKAVEATIKKSVNAVLKSLKNKESDEETKRKEVMAIADKMIDIPLIAKLVIGKRHWKTFKKSQRTEFTDLFIKQLQNSYFEKVDLLTDEVVEFEKPARKKNKIHISTIVISKDERYLMIYKLYKKKNKKKKQKKGVWKVYDVEVEGISLVKSYGSQYDQFLRKDSVKDLLKKMKEKTFGPPKDLEEQNEKFKRDKEKASKKED